MTDKKSQHDHMFYKVNWWIDMGMTKISHSDVVCSTDTYIVEYINTTEDGLMDEKRGNDMFTHFSMILSNISLLDRFVHSLSLFFAWKIEKSEKVRVGDCLLYNYVITFIHSI